ncbi:MAG: hypothetical protein PF487_01120 [Bacteroidales bacterium]|jgi:hypothetical protein|nr:hypothetical protein [Bacteroidales bacterium]
MNFTTISQAKKQTELAYLGKVNNSSKLMKNQKVSNQYTYGLYLAPANTSGYNVCSHSTPECRLGCLATSGRQAIEIFTGGNKIKNSRIKKSKLFFEHQEFFMQWLIAEIKAGKRKAERDDFYFSVRLNATSDIDWQNVKVNGLNIFEIFPDVNFYDYTKNAYKFINKAKNYHLTYSYTGRNWLQCKGLLKRGVNIAMVFNIKKEIELPTEYKGFKVINGDLTDYRIADAKGIIVGLKWKRIANREAEQQILNSCFVVNPKNVWNIKHTKETVKELV